MCVGHKNKEIKTHLEKIKECGDFIPAKVMEADKKELYNKINNKFKFVKEQINHGFEKEEI